MAVFRLLNIKTMKLSKILLSLLLHSPLISGAQIKPASQANSPVIDFISDTQQPMMVEKLFLKANHNIKATGILFSEIIKTNPQKVFMLGDIVSLGYSNHKWKKVDEFLKDCRQENTQVTGLLGNHDVMGRRKKGERNFVKRFPLNVRTGYVSVTDSVAVILLNSNFSTLSVSDKKIQDDWYQKTLEMLDSSEAIKAVIVTCHHAPYSNSKVVGSSTQVQNNFVPAYLKSKKAKLFITGHSHNFEHFEISGKSFLVIGGGGGLHQPLNSSGNSIKDEAINYKPAFHYLSVKRVMNEIQVSSYYLKEDFASFELGYSFETSNFKNQVQLPSLATTVK